MIWWIVLAFTVGTLVGILVMASLAACGYDDAYESGYRKALRNLTMDDVE